MKICNRKQRLFAGFRQGFLTSKRPFSIADLDDPPSRTHVRLRATGTAGVSGWTPAIVLACVLFWICPASAASHPPAEKQPAADVRAHPLIEVKELEYNFGKIMEGTEVEHEFIVKNAGTADLNIEDVRVDCGCTAVSFDPKISPKGEGKLKMKVSLKNYAGKVEKKATIRSNDPQTPELVVSVQGTVVPFIEVKPSADIVFRGMADQLAESVLELGASAAPFHITGAETNIGENIDYKLETIVEGKFYKLKVSNKLKRGNYGGFIRLATDMAQKPDIVIRVSGFVEGEISIKPEAILIGKLSASQPELLGKIIVSSNRDKPFEITRLTYDESLMSVSPEPSEDQTSYILEIKPKLENVPVGARKQSTLKIETDSNSDEKVEALVYLFNSVDQPEVK
jgi:hypothetical protein